MTTLTIENAPKTIQNKYGTNIDYKTLVAYLNAKKVKQLEKKYYNKEDDTY